MRASDAARDTSELIEQSVSQITDGANLVSDTNRAFQEVADQTNKVTQLVAEIATASLEQTHGVEQINHSNSEVDKVLQNNAASSEETAAAAEQMNAQAEQMKSLAKDLNILISGK